MASLIAYRGRLLVQFYYQKKMYREYLDKSDTRDDRRDAKIFLLDLEAALRRSNFDYAKWFPRSKRAPKAAPTPAVPTFSVYYARWIQTLEVSKATRKDYEYLANAFLERTRLGAMLLTAVTATEIREVVKTFTERNEVRRPVMFLQRARGMFDAAIDDGLLDRNPARRIKNPRSRVRPEPIEPFDAKEQTAILTAADGQDRNLITVLLGTGIRPGEALALRARDCELKSRKLVISGSLGRFGEGPTKTACSSRVIDLIDAVAPVIAALRDQISVPRVHGPVFANESGGFLNYTNWRDRAWRAILEDAKVPYRSPYACRHTFAVRMLEQGYDAVTVSRAMGHTSTQMLHRHYARWMIGSKGRISKT